VCEATDGHIRRKIPTIQRPKNDAPSISPNLTKKSWIPSGSNRKKRGFKTFSYMALIYFPSHREKKQKSQRATAGTNGEKPLVFNGFLTFKNRQHFRCHFKKNMVH